MRLGRLAAGLIVMSCTGCLAPLERFEATLEDAGLAQFASSNVTKHTVIVQSSPSRQGHGAIISHDQVLTVEHVVGDASEVLVKRGERTGWLRARVLRRIPSKPENLVVLGIDVDEGLYGVLLGFTGFDNPVRPSLGGSPTRVASSRGELSWHGAALRPGDSGSPVLDALGDLVGLVVGRRGGIPVLAPLPASCTALTRR